MMKILVVEQRRINRSYAETLVGDVRLCRMMPIGKQPKQMANTVVEEIPVTTGL